MLTDLKTDEFLILFKSTGVSTVACFVVCRPIRKEVVSGFSFKNSLCFPMEFFLSEPLVSVLLLCLLHIDKL